MTHKEIINDLLDKKIAILAGAGISYDSGLPVVSAFYEKFLPFFYEKEDVSYLTKLIYEEHIPFERMMEHIFSYTGDDYSILNIFANGESNTLHNILAQMISNGWADELYTTNFDCLIEKSLEAIGITANKDYGYFYEESKFSNLSKSLQEKKVIKLHGTIDKKESIRTTLETITAKKQLTKRKPPIERLYATGPHDVVIVLGYSFSDIFDISEFITKINISKTIIVIDHKKGQKEDNNIQLLINKSGNNPFLGKECNGYVINVDTLSFMSELCMKKYGNVPIANFKKYDWQNDLDNWSVKFDNIYKMYIAGGICNSMDEFKVGKKYITQALNNINQNRVGLYIGIINQYVLTQFRTRKDQKECGNLVSWCKTAIGLLETHKNLFSDIDYINLLVDLKYRLGRIYEDGYFDYKEAKKYYFSVYRIEYKRNDLLERSKCLHEIGKTYASLNNITSAMKCFKKSVKLKKGCGYVGGLTRTYYTMAAAIFENNCKNSKQAEYYLQKASDSVHITGETELIYYINNLQGIFYMYRYKWDKAESIFKENISKLGTQPHITPLITANYNLARCEIRLKKYQSAIDRLEKNLKIINDLGNKHNIFKNNIELAVAYLLYDDTINCYEHLLISSILLNTVTNAEKAHYFFYVSLFYKKYNLNYYYKSYLDASKIFFQHNETLRDFYFLKRDIDSKINPDNTLILEKEKYLLPENFCP